MVCTLYHHNQIMYMYMYMHIHTISYVM